MSKKPFRSYTERALSDTEYKRMLEKAPSFEDEVMLRLGVELGLRRYDLSKLQVKDVRIDVEPHVMYFYEFKKKRIRSLPLNNELSAILKRFLNSIPKRDFLFAWGDGSDKTAYNHLQKIATLAGVKTPLPFHALRGTCYKRKKDQKWSIEQAAAWLGDDVRTAMEHYGVVSEGELRDLVKRGDAGCLK